MNVVMSVIERVLRVTTLVFVVPLAVGYVARLSGAPDQFAVGMMAGGTITAVVLLAAHAAAHGILAWVRGGRDA